jgi:membrane-associated phospholipid phosphatase
MRLSMANDAAKQRGEIVSDLAHPKTPGVALGSRSARRIEARSGGPAERLGTRLRPIPSLLVSWIVANVGAVLLASAMVGLGFLVTKGLLSIGGVAHADERLPVWFAAHRTPFWTDLSRVGSTMAGASVIVPVIGVTALALALWHRWRTSSFIIQAALAETLAYSLTVYFVHRQRPSVPKLDTYALNHSFPSGHVAASVAVCGALALLLTARFRGVWPRILIWTTAAAIPAFVAWSRMYRGEHHPIDVAGGALMGLGALTIAVFAARTARRTAELHVLQRAAKARA